MSLSVQPAQAEVQTNIKVPVTIGVFIPCAAGGAGEVVFRSYLARLGSSGFTANLSARNELDSNPTAIKCSLSKTGYLRQLPCFYLPRMQKKSRLIKAAR